MPHIPSPPLLPPAGSPNKEQQRKVSAHLAPPLLSRSIAVLLALARSELLCLGVCGMLGSCGSFLSLSVATHFFGVVLDLWCGIRWLGL